MLDENRKAVNEYDIERNRASWVFDAGRASAAGDVSDAHSGLPAIRFDGRSQYLQGTNGLGMNLPGPFTLVVVATVKDGWPKAIFSLVPESGAITGRIHDYNSPFAIAFHCATGTAGTGGFGLSQGSIGGVNLSLTVPCAKPGRPESAVICSAGDRRRSRLRLFGWTT